MPVSAFFRDSTRLFYTRKRLARVFIYAGLKMRQFKARHGLLFLTGTGIHGRAKTGRRRADFRAGRGSQPARAGRRAPAPFRPARAGRGRFQISRNSAALSKVLSAAFWNFSNSFCKLCYQKRTFLQTKADFSANKSAISAIFWQKQRFDLRFLVLIYDSMYLIPRILAPQYGQNLYKISAEFPSKLLIVPPHFWQS